MAWLRPWPTRIPWCEGFVQHLTTTRALIEVAKFGYAVFELPGSPILEQPNNMFEARLSLPKPLVKHQRYDDFHRMKLVLFAINSC